MFLLYQEGISDNLEHYRREFTPLSSLIERTQTSHTHVPTVFLNTATRSSHVAFLTASGFLGQRSAQLMTTAGYLFLYSLTIHFLWGIHYTVYATPTFFLGPKGSSKSQIYLIPAILKQLDFLAF